MRTPQARDMILLLKVCLLLYVAGALAEPHRPAVVAEVGVPEEDQEHPPSDVIGDVALRDHLETLHRARALRLFNLRRQQQRRRQQQQQQQQQPDGYKPESEAKPRLGQNAPAVASRAAAGGSAAYSNEGGDDDYGEDDVADSDALYADDDDEDKRGDVRGGGDTTKGGERRSGGRVRSSHRDPYTDVDDGDDHGGDNYGAEHRKEKQPAEAPEDKGGAGAASGTDDRLGSAKARDEQRLRKRMDCIVDRVNHCIEWCRLKPTDTRLRQNRDNEPCRYWKGDAKNKWMQSGICRNGRCS